MTDDTTADEAEIDDKQLTDATALAVSSTYKVRGEIDADDGTGVLGKNTADSGTPIGVEGAVPNSSSGYGLSTPHDARVGGTAELAALSGALTGDQEVSDLVGGGLDISGGGALIADLNAVGSGVGVLDGVGASGIDYRSLSGADGLSVTENSGTVTLGVTGTETNTASTFTESDLSLRNSRTTVTDGAIELIDDATVDRPSDNNTFGDVTDRYGIEIEPKVDLESITVTISSNTSGETNVYVQETDETVLASESSPGSGNSVTLTASLSAGTRYWVSVDAEGSSYTAGYYDSASFPIESSTVKIVEGILVPIGTYPSYALTISSIQTSISSGTATLEWSRPSSVSRWERVAFDTDKDGERVEMYVETSSDGGSTWSTWEPDGDGNARPVAPGTDLSSIPPGDRVRLRAELSRNDTSNNPRLTLASRQWRP